MSKQTKVYSPLEFLDRLDHDDLSEPFTDDLRKPLKLTGMIKKAENNDNQVLFAVGTNGTNWRKVSLDIIDNIEELDDENYDHPLVKMSFKMPESEEALLFASFVNDVLYDAKQVVVKQHKKIEESGAMARTPTECSDCWRGCNINSPEDYFYCLDKCSGICPG